MSSHQIRIIGGQFRGRKVAVIDAQSLRPTPNRVRETLFNWLQFDIASMKTLDLFAGSGILSFEALSRGAKNATLVEKNKSVLNSIKKAGHFCDPKTIKYHHCDALTFIKEQPLNDYSLIFLDAPFDSTLLNDTLSALKGKIAKDCLLYIESSERRPVEKFDLSVKREQKAGSVYFGLYQASP